MHLGIWSDHADVVRLLVERGDGWTSGTRFITARRSIGRSTADG